MTASAGWYPDPGGTPKQRYWDGRVWTGQLRDAADSFAAPRFASASGHLSEDLSPFDQPADGPRPGPALLRDPWEDDPVLGGDPADLAVERDPAAWTPQESGESYARPTRRSSLLDDPDGSVSVHDLTFEAAGLQGGSLPGSRSVPPRQHDPSWASAWASSPAAVPGSPSGSTPRSAPRPRRARQLTANVVTALAALAIVGGAVVFASGRIEQADAQASAESYAIPVCAQIRTVADTYIRDVDGRQVVEVDAAVPAQTASVSAPYLARAAALSTYYQGLSAALGSVAPPDGSEHWVAVYRAELDGRVGTLAALIGRLRSEMNPDEAAIAGELTAAVAPVAAAAPVGSTEWALSAAMHTTADCQAAAAVLGPGLPPLPGS
jgi:hypothetical protein